MEKNDTKKLALCIVKKLDALYPTVKPALIYKKPHELLFAVILSAQTTDLHVNKVTKTLFEKYKKIGDYIEADLYEFQKDISSIGLYRAKAKNIIASAKILRDKHNGKVPRKMEELIELPGVGRKTANVVLFALYDINEGIAVDTHVKRLAQKYCLTKETDPVKIERDLMNSIPKSEWGKFALRFIQYGRDYCPANCKKCPNCPLWECII